jgi:fructose-specific phosphotransferase system component IIB
MKISVVCDNKECATLLENAGKELNIEVVCEVQNGVDISNEISESEIRLSNAVLFAIDGEVEDIEKIERFIDCEYYEVEPKFVVADAKNVLSEIVSDIN